MIGLAVLWVAAERYGVAKYLTAGARVGGYALIVGTALGALSVHKAHAALGEQGLALGEDLASMASVLQDAHTITVNGQRIHLATGVTLKGRAEVLDDFVASCKANAPAETQVWNSLPDPSDQHPKSIDAMPIYRDESGNHGIVLCISPTASTQKRTFQQSLDAFFQTGEMSELGRFRYIYVTESSKGSAVVSAWTDEKFNMFALEPDPDKESVGADPQIMVRPNDSMRLLSASVDGLPYRVYAYHTHSSAKASIDSYDAQMHAAGWVSVAPPLFESAPHDGEVRGYLKNGTLGFATVMTDEKGVTMLAIGESGTIDHGAQAPAKEADGF